MPPLKPFNTPVEVLGYEIIQEQATALGRLGRALEAALADLRAFDAVHDRPDGVSQTGASPGDSEARHALVAIAGRALWMFVVQREACGLRETRNLMRDYKVPMEVQDRMGVFPARKGGAL
jgi:Family of unknown function (DUF6665)